MLQENIFPCRIFHFHSIHLLLHGNCVLTVEMFWRQTLSHNVSRGGFYIHVNAFE